MQFISKRIWWQNSYSILHKYLSFTSGKLWVISNCIISNLRIFFLLPQITSRSFFKNNVAISLYTFKAIYFAFSAHQVIFPTLEFLKTNLDKIWISYPHSATFFNKKIQLCKPLCLHWIPRVSLYYRISKYYGLDVCRVYCRYFKVHSFFLPVCEDRLRNRILYLNRFLTERLNRLLRQETGRMTGC